MVSVSALPRRALRAVVVVAFVAVLVALLSVHSTAHADPYPPTGPTTSSTVTDPGPPQSGTSAPRTTDDGSSRNLAETGFATLTATVIAVGLLGGGVLLVAVGRRRGARKS